MKKLNYLLIILIILLTFACDEDETNLCKNNSCEEWQECNENTGKCSTKLDFCANNGECSGVDVYCDETTHTCKENDKCEGVQCYDYEQCNPVIGECELKENACNEDGDCNGENVFCDNHECKIIPNHCDNIDCDNHGECGVVENDAVKKAVCTCDRGFINKQDTRCLEKTCANESPIGHTQEYATNPKTAPFKEKNGISGHWYYPLEADGDLSLCPDTKDIFKFNDKFPIIKLTGSQAIVRFYENSIADENLVTYKVNRNAEYGDDDFGMIQVDNPDSKDIYMVVSSNEDNSIYYHFEFIENCGSNDLCIMDYTCNTQNRCVIDCAGGNDCPSGTRCNDTTNICEDFACTNDFECGEAYCIDGSCLALGCSENTDCSVMSDNDLNNRNFECIYNGCEPVYDMNFGESQNFKLNDTFHTFVVRIPVTDTIANFTLTIDGIGNIRNLKPYLIRVDETRDYMKSTFDYGSYTYIPNVSNLDFYISPILTNTEFITLIGHFVFEYCEGNCNDINPNIILGNNNTNGCNINEDCELAFRKSICTNEHSCIANIEEGISNQGEPCDKDVNCQDNLLCYGLSGICDDYTCNQDSDCSIRDGKENYCFESIGGDKYCNFYCEETAECPQDFKNDIRTICNLNNHKCEYLEE